MADEWVCLTSCFFPTRAPIKMLEVSAGIQGVEPLRTYGEGRLYENWTRMKVHEMIPVLEGLRSEGFTHYLYTDGRDAIFTRSWEYIKQTYVDLGSPDGLLSAQTEAFCLTDLAPHWDHLKPARYRFHCCGGYMGRIDWWIETHKRFVRDNYESRETGGDEAGVWQWAWVDGWFRPKLDTECQIFQNLGGTQDVKLCRLSGPANFPNDVIFGPPEVLNTHTLSRPAILHFTGYCKDAVYGVYDDMRPWWDALYPGRPVSKEEVAAA